MSSIYINFIKYLYEYSDSFLLNYGCALAYCYNLDRNINKITLVGPRGYNNIISNIIINYSLTNELEYKLLNNTNSRLEYNINDEVFIETRFVNEINYNNIISINNVKLYNINRIANSINNRLSVFNRLEDMYDIVYIVKYYWNLLSSYTKDGIRDAFTFNGISYYINLIDNNNCDLIDKGVLKDNFISIYDKLGLGLDGDNLYEG